MSPASWPSESLTTLKLSRSMKRTATRCAGRRQVERAADPLVEEEAVRQPRHGVVVRLVLQQRLGVAAGREVHHVRDGVADVPLGIVDARALDQRPAVGPVGAPVARLGGHRVGVAAQGGRAALVDDVDADHRLEPVDGVPGHLRQRPVRAHEAAVAGDDGHPDRSVLEGAAELLLALERACPHVLVEPPRDDVDDAQRQHEERVDERPLPGVADGVGVVVDALRVERPDQPVVDQDEPDRDQVRHPLLVVGEHRDHHEEVEVRLGRAVREVHQRGRRGERSERDHAGARPAGEPRRRGAGRGHGDADEAGAQAQQRRVLDQDAEQREPDDVAPHHAEHPPMAALPHVPRQRAAARQRVGEPHELQAQRGDQGVHLHGYRDVRADT